MSIKPLAAPGGGPRKNKGNKRNQRSKLGPSEPPPRAPESPARLLPPPPAAPPAQVQLQGQAVLSPRVPRVTSGDSFDRGRQERRGPAPPIAIPQRQLIDLRMSGGRRGKKARAGGSINQRWNVEHRALQRLRSSLSEPTSLSPAPPALLQPSPAAPRAFGVTLKSGRTIWQQSLG